MSLDWLRKQCLLQLLFLGDLSMRMTDDCYRQILPDKDNFWAICRFLRFLKRLWSIFHQIIFGQNDQHDWLTHYRWIKCICVWIIVHICLSRNQCFKGHAKACHTTRWKNHVLTSDHNWSKGPMGLLGISRAISYGRNLLLDLYCWCTSIQNKKYFQQRLDLSATQRWQAWQLV